MPSSALHRALIVLLLALCWIAVESFQPSPSWSGSRRRALPPSTLPDPRFFRHVIPQGLIWSQSPGTVQDKSNTDGKPVEKDDRPYPEIGDVVSYPGKWEEDSNIGQIRFLQFISTRKKWIADIAPFKEVGQDLYRAEKGAGLVTAEVDTLKPVSAFFIRAPDAYRIIYRQVNDTRVPMALASGYKTDGLEVGSRKVDPVVVQQAKEEYSALKNRILKDTAVFGTAAALVASIKAGTEDGLIFEAGVLGSLLYLFMLQQKADSLGAPNNVARLGKALGAARFLVPVALVAGLALRHSILEGGESPASLFNYIPRDEFWSVVLGFLSYRVPMVVREIGDTLQRIREDRANQGTVGTLQVVSSALKRATNKGREPAQSAAGSFLTETTLLVISGPEGMNRTALSQRLLQEDKSDRFGFPVWVTTRAPRMGEVDGTDYHFSEPFAFKVNREKGRFLMTYQDEQGEWYGLRTDDILAVTQKQRKCCVLAVDPYSADELLTIPGARIIAVWVTLKNLDQFRQRYRSLLQANPPKGMDPNSPQAEAQVEASVSEAMRAVEHGILQDYYEFTIYDDAGPEDSFKKLQQFVDFALAL